MIIPFLVITYAVCSVFSLATGIADALVYNTYEVNVAKILFPIYFVGYGLAKVMSMKIGGN